MTKKGFKIVLMGVDNSGKTTLAKNLVEAFNLMAEDASDSFSYRPPLGPAPLEKQLGYMDEVLYNEENLIIDRLPLIEEEVVGRTLRNKSNFDSVNKIKVLEYYKNVDCIILCNPPLEVVTQWGERSQMDGVKDNVEELYKGYENFCGALIRELLAVKTTSFHFYDWSKDVIGKRLYNLVSSIMEEKMKKEREI